jgi:predicted MPP superfamily phosphohydrolase
MDLIRKFANKKLGFFAGAFLGIGYVVYLYASKIENRSYRLETLSLNLHGINNDFPNIKTLKVLHLSDLHLSAPETHKIDFLQRLSDIECDLVFLTGDIFEDESGIQYASTLAACRPRLGTYAVLGNHDYYAYTMLHRTIGRLSKKHRQPSTTRDVSPMINALEASGITVLRDETVNLSEEQIYIIGIDYPYIEEKKLQKLVADAPGDFLRLALMHVPKNMAYLCRAGVDVAFLGHTHGGQVRIPGIGALTSNSELPRTQASGLIWMGDTAFHISRGLGSDPKTNFRLFCPPAATLIEINYKPVHSLVHGKWA